MSDELYIWANQQEITFRATLRCCGVLFSGILFVLLSACSHNPVEFGPEAYRLYLMGEAKDKSFFYQTEKGKMRGFFQLQTIRFIMPLPGQVILIKYYSKPQEKFT